MLFRSQPEPAVGTLGKLHDASHRSNSSTQIATSHFAPSLDQHDAEVGMLCSTARSDHRPVPRLEDVQPHQIAREEHGSEREHGEAAYHGEAISAGVGPLGYEDSTEPSVFHHGP